MSKYQTGSNDDFDDDLFDESEDEDALPESDEPGFDVVDPEFENPDPQDIIDEEIEVRNPDGTLKHDWEDRLARRQKLLLAKQVVQQRVPRSRDEPAPPPGELVAFQARPGNYIMAVGLPGSGKTVLQSHILHYLFNSSLYDASSDPVAGTAQSQLKTLNYWKKCWREGRFPESTHVDRADHFRYVVRTHADRIINRPFRFGFVEISGEHFKRIEGAEGDNPLLPEAIQNHLANKKCRIVFLLVCNPAKDPRRDDDFFQSFIDYFNFHPELKFRKDSPIAFVLGNPKAAREYIEPHLNKAIERGQEGSERNTKLIDLRDRVTSSTATGDALARLYLRLVLKKTRSSLKGWKGPKRTFGFSIGETKYNKEWGESEVINTDFADAKAVFGWAYKQTTRVTLPKLFGVTLFDDND